MQEGLKLVNKSCKFLYFMKFLISCVLRGSVLIIPIFYSYAVEKITAGDLNGAYLLGIFLLIFTVVYYISEMVNDYAYEKLYYKLYLGLTKLSLKTTEKNSIYSLSRITLSEYNSILTNDINVIADCYGSIPMVIARIIEISLILYYFFSVNILVGILAIVVLIIVAITLYFGNKKVNTINAQDKASNDKRLEILQEYFLGMKEVKGFRLFNVINNRIKKSSGSYLDWHTKYGLSKVIVKYGALSIIDISKVLFLFYGFYLAYHGEMSLAIIILVYSYFEKLVSSFTGFLDFNNKLQDASVAKKRLLKLDEYSRESELKENEKIIGRGYIDFNNIVYGNKEDPILNHFTAHINSNSITAVIGPTRAGKTGIIDLLLKLNQQHEGEIKIDKVNISDYADEIYFSSVAAVRKNPSFFNMSIRDNLEIIEPDFEKIVEVCKDIDIHDDIMRLPNGYDTIISETASNVTNDIKYLLSIVRVVLKNPKILLFDETLNAFSKETDMKLMEYFRKTKGKRTVIIITNEKHVIEESDNVIYMEKGENIISGKHEALLLKSDKYKNYFEEL